MTVIGVVLLMATRVAVVCAAARCGVGYDIEIRWCFLSDGTTPAPTYCGLPWTPRKVLSSITDEIVTRPSAREFGRIDAPGFLGTHSVQVGDAAAFTKAAIEPQIRSA